MQAMEVTNKKTIRTIKATPAKRKDNYVTKRIVRSVAKSAFTKAAKVSMAVMGYNVVAERGWIVKKYADGRIEKLNPIPNNNSTINIVLD